LDTDFYVLLKQWAAECQQYSEDCRRWTQIPGGGGRRGRGPTIWSKLSLCFVFAWQAIYYEK